MDNFHYEENALCDITNFIDQEIYVLAVRSSYPSEYEQIIKLADYLKGKLNPVNEEFYDESVSEEIIELIVNYLATGETLDALHSEINDYLDSTYHIKEYAEDSVYLNKVDSTKAKFISCASCAHKEFGKISFSFIHQYPPSLFSINNNHLFALLYFYNKEYLPKKKEFIDGEEITFTNAPYKIMRRYNYSRYRTRHIQHEVDIPINTLKKSMQKGDFKINISNKNDALIQECISLLGFRDKQRVSYTNELRISIDTSSPLDDFEVDRILAMLRCELSTLQRENKHSEYQIAQNMNDLERATKIPDISTDDYVALKKLHTPQIEKLKTDLNAKNYLCGLIILYRYLFERSASSTSLEKLCSDLSDELMNSIKIDGSKFSSDTILRGYKQVKKIFQAQEKILGR